VVPEFVTFAPDRAVVQAVSRWLPTAAARVPVGVVVDKAALGGTGFLRVLRFPLPIIPQFLHHHIHPELAQ
jgi:hypothetical protein